MYPIPKSEIVVQTKICKHCGTEFPITDKDLEFYDKVSPKFGDVKYNIPAPTLCPDCRQQRRLTWRNERKLYKRKCDATGKDIISMHKPDKPFKVYDYDTWWSDTWNPLDYGKNFDFSRSFIEQFSELMREVPMINMSRMTSENSDYCNQAGDLSNCYLCFNADFSQDCLYCSSIQHSKNCIDCFRVKDCELCQYSCDLENCFNCENCQFCFDCTASLGLFDCRGCSNCSNCFACENLQGKKFYAQGKAVSESEYFELLEKYRKEQFNSNIGNEDVFRCKKISKSSNSAFVTDSTGVENCKFCSNITNTNTSYDIDFFGINIELAYDSPTVGAGFSRSAFCENIGGDVSDIFYCLSCMNGASHLFWCIGLRGQQYCILNKQYTGSEYEALVPKIIEHMRRTGEWGEFFPSSLSPFGYNETVAQEFFPLSKDEAVSKGFVWSDYEAPFPKVEKIVPATKLPSDIAEVPDDILNWAIECEVTGKPFRIIKPELEFYRKHGLPIPRRHPDQRHMDRLKKHLKSN